VVRDRTRSSELEFLQEKVFYQRGETRGMNFKPRTATKNIVLDVEARSSPKAGKIERQLETIIVK
jgi:hypothetical protein